MNRINEFAVLVHARLGFWPQVQQPSPNFTGPGVSALQSIANVVFGIVLTLAIIAGLAAAAMIVMGHFSGNNRLQKAGIIGVVSVVAGVAVAGSMAGLINWGAALKVA